MIFWQKTQLFSLSVDFPHTREEDSLWHIFKKSIFWDLYFQNRAATQNAHILLKGRSEETTHSLIRSQSHSLLNRCKWVWMGTNFHKSWKCDWVGMNIFVEVAWSALSTKQWYDSGLHVLSLHSLFIVILSFHFQWTNVPGNWGLIPVFVSSYCPP